jgi:pimeloyl-ACP methyl ester carboxylesterase
MAAAEEWVDARHDLISLPDVGHLPHEEAPAAVTAAIIDWLRAL